MEIRIQIPDWVIEEFNRSGLAPQSWSQQAVSSAIRQAALTQANAKGQRAN